MNEELFVKHTSMAFKMSTSKFRRMVENWLSHEQKVVNNQTPTDSERLDAMSILTARLPARTTSEIWVFRTRVKRTDPFQGVLNQWLPYRLGLHLKAGERRLTFGFWGRHIAGALRPRFFDVHWSYLPLWNWNGFTQPLSGTPSTMSGFEELIADPPLLREIVRPVQRILVK